MVKATRKDYSLKGSPEGQIILTEDAFEEKVEEEWFSAQIDRKKLKQLMKRSDNISLRHF